MRKRYVIELNAGGVPLAGIEVLHGRVVRWAASDNAYVLHGDPRYMRLRTMRRNGFLRRLAFTIEVTGDSADSADVARSLQRIAESMGYTGRILFPGRRAEYGFGVQQ